MERRDDGHGGQGFDVAPKGLSKHLWNKRTMCLCSLRNVGGEKPLEYS